MFLLSYPSPLFLVASFFPWGHHGVCEPLWVLPDSPRQIRSINCTALLWKVRSLVCLGYQFQNLLSYKYDFKTADCKNSVLLLGKRDLCLLRNVTFIGFESNYLFVWIYNQSQTTTLFLFFCQGMCLRTSSSWNHWDSANIMDMKVSSLCLATGDYDHLCENNHFENNILREKS